MEQPVQWLVRLVAAVVVIPVLGAVLLVAVAAGPGLFGYRPYVVLSGSMTPTIPVGAVVVDQPVTPAQLKSGDIFTFFTQVQPGVAVTHRLLSVGHDGGALQLHTKGDANAAEDIGTVDLTKPVARVIYWVPWAGYVVNFLRHNQASVVVLLLGTALLLFWARTGP